MRCCGLYEKVIILRVETLQLIIQFQSFQSGNPDIL